MRMRSAFKVPSHPFSLADSRLFSHKLTCKIPQLATIPQILVPNVANGDTGMVGPVVNIKLICKVRVANIGDRTIPSYLAFRVTAPIQERRAGNRAQ